MKKLIFLFLASLGFSAQAQNLWSVDTYHTSVTFSATHMMFSQVAGSFGMFDIKLSNIKSPADFTGALIDATVEVNSITTGVEKRDAHLKSADFFDAPNHAQIKFKSTAFKKLSETKYQIIGDLTIRGTTKTVTFDATMLGGAKDQKGKYHFGWKATTKINRTDYGLNWNVALEAGGVLVSEEIEITVFAEALEG